VVVFEAELDGDSVRAARRYFASGEHVRLEPVGEGFDELQVSAENLIVMGVVVARLRFDAAGQPIEEPLMAVPGSE
jgi:hypothetical protein